MEFTNSPVCIKDLEHIASKVMHPSALSYYNSGADDEQTKLDNIAAFDKYRIYPRILRDVTTISTETTILGQQMATPLGIAPCAMHMLAHPAGELATSRAAAQHGGVMILSTLSTIALERVIAEGNPDMQYWMQLYVLSDRSITEKIVQRSERAGFKALVLTVDMPILGRRRDDIRTRFIPPPHIHFENFFDPESASNSEGAAPSTYNDVPELLLAASVAGGNPAVTWDNVIPWLKSITKLPIILKGILTAEDTKLAISYGCAGVIVSNHGGRQLDGTLASIDALPQVVEAAEDKIE
ncbi:Hydroxyacid oxidase 1, partial [Linderina pennispora]